MSQLHFLLMHMWGGSGDGVGTQVLAHQHGRLDGTPSFALTVGGMWGSGLMEDPFVFRVNSNIHDLGFDNSFLAITPKAQAIKKYFVRMKFQGKLSRKQKDKPTNEKVFANPMYLIMV